MADIIGEINTIGDLLADVGVSRFYKQDFPKVYVANTIGIRWQGDSNEGFTQAAYAIDRIYQVVYFGKSEVDCLTKAEAVSEKISDTIKVKLRDSDDYMTLESFNMSAPFKTDTDGVYAVSGVLRATVRKAYTQQAWQKMGVIHASINEGGN